METILCPTDFSTTSLNAAEYGCGLGEKFRSRIILFHVNESVSTMADEAKPATFNADSVLRKTAAKNLEALKQDLVKKFHNVSIEAQLATGTGHREIVAAANKEDADVIVMGTTGSSEQEETLMGSTTARVLNIADCPVLCIPKGAGFSGIKKIVFATDLREDNISSAMTITPFARAFGAELVFVFVDDKHLIHSESEINKMAREIRKRVNFPKISGYIAASSSVTGGIDYFLKKVPADLLVMFTNLKHLPEALFNQSHTRDMSHQTSIPLLALKAADRPAL